MYPFQVWNEEFQRVDFHFDKWAEFSSALHAQYPVNDHARIEMELIFPSQRLEDVWVHDWNPHHAIGNYHLSVYDCFYDSSNWSTIFDVYPGCGSNYKRVFVEEGHESPWGEPVRLMSTANNIYNEASHRYAYFRGLYWKVLTFRKHYFRWDRWDVRRIWDIWDDVLEYNNDEFVYPSLRYRREETNINWMKEGF